MTPYTRKFTEPVQFEEAVAVLTAKQDRATAMNTRQIAATWDAETKRRAFFSARVADADLLAEIHRRVSQVMRGEMSDGQARELLRVFLENDGRDALAAMGFAPPSLDGGLAELGSTRRLDLIVYQNTKMAEEVGAYKEWTENADMFPYGRWRIGVSEKHRDEHVARDGRVYRFDHPIWTTDPPGGRFNCHCYREELTAAQVRAEGLTVQRRDSALEPSPLGFDPSKGLGDPVPMKETVPADIRAEVRQALGMAPA